MLLLLLLLLLLVVVVVVMLVVVVVVVAAAAARTFLTVWVMAKLKLWDNAERILYLSIYPSMYMYIYIYIHIHIHYVYLYLSIYLSISIYLYLSLSIYIYIYRERERHAPLYIHPVSLRRFPSFRTQPLENLTPLPTNKWISEQPSPWRKSSKRESCYGDRVYTLRSTSSRRAPAGCTCPQTLRSNDNSNSKQ